MDNALRGKRVILPPLVEKVAVLAQAYSHEFAELE